MMNSYNPALVHSIPLRNKSKTYFLHHYHVLKTHCGLKYAQSIYKDLRLAFMRYISREWNISELLDEVHRLKIKRTHHLRYLIETSKSHPYLILNFLKFPTGDLEVKGDEQGTYDDLWEELQEFNPGFNKDLDTLMNSTIQLCIQDSKKPKINRRPGLADAFAPITNRQIKNLAKSISKTKSEYVHPCQYKDAIRKDNDAWNSPSFIKDLNSWNYLMNEQAEISVGEIHLVKKGNDDFRAVAAPNRFVQLQLAPFRTFIEFITHKVRTDSTYNQSRHDAEIECWVSDPKIRPYGVDIHHATNTLPFNHGEWLVGKFLRHFYEDLYKVDCEYSQLRYENEILVDGSKTLRAKYYERKSSIIQEISDSWSRFRRVSSRPWDFPDGRQVQFKTGQPLGTWGSFPVLNLQNHLYAEMAVRYIEHCLRRMRKEGDNSHNNLIWDLSTNKQYAILGDDVVFKHKIVGECYIKILKGYKVPLSLHKSFSSNLVEFAGKVFVKNQECHYITDHNILTFNNLLEWSQATGIPLQWNNLPHGFRKEIHRRVNKNVPNLLANVGIMKNGWSLTSVAHVFNKACKTLAGRATTRSKNYDAQLHRNDWRDLFDLLLYELKSIGVRESSQFSGMIEVQGIGIYHVREAQFGRLTEKEVKRSGRPKWKETKFQSESVDILLAAALGAQYLKSMGSTNVNRSNLVGKEA